MTENNTSNTTPQGVPPSEIPAKSSQTLVIAAVVLVLVLALASFAFFKDDKGEVKNDTDGAVIEPVTKTPTQSTTTTQVTTPSVVLYKDGTYEAEGSYSSPAGKENIRISLTVKDDMITAASATPLASNPTSKKFQDQFVSGFKTEVVGKKLSEVMLSKVSGASLTPKGFNDAVIKMREEAKA